MDTRILLVDDDPSTRILFDGLLRKPRFTLTTATTLAAARELMREGDFNLVLLDQRLPDGNGLDFFTEIRASRPLQAAILVTGYADVQDAMSAVRKGLFDYLTKPFENLDALEAVIARALQMDRATREAATRHEPGHHAARGTAPVVGESVAMLQLNHQIRQIAHLHVTVLIEGESGTGKDVCAHQLHALSNRADARMLELNCGALTETLLEATLFGYEKGAFTGAARSMPGYFEAADGGTLFLDEIADMSPKLQASLLRVLQDQTFARIGSTVQRHSDFRLICATNRSLDEEVRQGNFRPDLFYRLNVVNLRMPPLRERRADILPLAMSFIDECNRRFDKHVGPLSADAAARLESAPWPGNVRELKHTIERTVAIQADGPIYADDLCGLRDEQGTSPGEPPALRVLYRDARDDFERRYFSALLRTAGGNVSEAARQSGIARQNFHAHLRRLGLV